MPTDPRCNHGACVVWTVTPDGVQVSDSKHPGGPVLQFTAAEWEAHTADLTAAATAPLLTRLAENEQALRDAMSHAERIRDLETVIEDVRATTVDAYNDVVHIDDILALLPSPTDGSTDG